MEKEKRVIRLEFVTTTTVAERLEKNLLSLADTKVQLKRPEKEEQQAFAAGTGTLAEQFFMLILTASSNFATIASLIYQIRRNKESEKPSVIFRFGDKSIEISGKFSKDDLEWMLDKFAEVATGDKEEKLIDEARRDELEKELSDLKGILPTYQKLTQPEEWKKSEESLKKLSEYQNRQREIENRIAELERLLSS